MLVFVTQFSTSIYFKMIFTENLVISPYKDIGIDYIPHTVYFIPTMHLFCIWMFPPYNFPHLFPSYCYPSPWATTCFSLCVCFCFMFAHLLCFSDFTYKWNDIVFVLFCLIYFPWHNRPSRSIHVVTNGKISFFLWLSNIPLSLYTKSSVSIHLFGGIKFPSISWLLKMMLQQKQRCRKFSNYSVFIFFRSIPRSGIAGSYGSFTFNFLRHLFPVFHSGGPMFVLRYSLFTTSYVWCVQHNDHNF